jgi:hypothetical protein
MSKDIQNKIGDDKMKANVTGKIPLTRLEAPRWAGMMQFLFSIKVMDTDSRERNNVPNIGGR